MKASLYAVRVGEEWTWRATLNKAVDWAYWYHHTGGKAEILQLHPPVSWGQALWVQQWLNARLKGNLRLDFIQVRGEMIKALTVLKASPALFPRLELSLADLKRVDCGPWERSGEPANGCKNGHPKAASWVHAMQGRALLPNEWLDLRHDVAGFRDLRAAVDMSAELQAAYLQEQIQLSQGVRRLESSMLWLKSSGLLCSRCGCGTEHMRWTHCEFCEGPCPYCESCLTMGRARFCTPLIQGTVSEKLSVQPAFARSLKQWGLNGAQKEAAAAGLEFLRETSKSIICASTPTATVQTSRLNFLIWAVTGAGKTEMIYPLIDHELAYGRKVMIATPRKDVVLELMPRIQAAFPMHSLVALYGGSRQRWEQGDITLATTHQLMRFYQGFDLVILDELDAYPYHNNPMLEFAAQKACKPQGRFIFLSATPPIGLQRKAKHKTLPHIKVPVRFHQHPLPVPQLLSIRPMRQWVEKQAAPPAYFKKPTSMVNTPIPVKLLKVFEHSLERGAQLFVFVSQIRHVEPMVLWLRAYFQDKVIHGTHSQDEERGEKVVDFRQTRTDILVTTTILERGITVAKTDVFVLDADAALFDEASLVQMAGRAGRSKDDPYGNVYFAAWNKTKAQVTAIKQIKRMNEIARKKGYLSREERSDSLE
jgi:competence protein ComFA